MPFQVVVVGAGIAGLAAAIALRGEGKEVTVLESSRLKSEIGAAIHLAPNATKILHRWGIDIQKEARALVVREMREIGASGEIHVKVPMDTAKIFGAPWLLQHRVDLHNALRRAAEATAGAGVPAKIVTGAKVSSVDAESGTVKTEDGQSFQGDLIVGADGIHSIVRNAVLEETNIARPSGHSAYRCLISRDDLVDIPEAMEVFEQDKAKLFIVVGGDRRVILYPCRDGTILNIVAVCPDKFMKEESTQSWNAVGTTEDLLQVYEAFPEWLKRTLSLAKEPGLWQLRDQDPLPTWVKGRAIIIGDAAHAMLPHQGQGAGQSIEDAEALGALFSDAKSNQSTQDVNAVLEKIFKARIKRASLVQAYSRQQAMPAGKEDGLFLNAQQFSGYNWAYEGVLAWIEKEASEEKKAI